MTPDEARKALAGLNPGDRIEVTYPMTVRRGLDGGLHVELEYDSGAREPLWSTTLVVTGATIRQV
jgi:hypothetical protein